MHTGRLQRGAELAELFSGAARCRCDKGRECPWINEPGAKIPFNVFCQVLGGGNTLGSCWCWSPDLDGTGLWQQRCICLPVLLQLVSNACSGWKSPWREVFAAYSARQAGASCLKIVIPDIALIKSYNFCIKVVRVRAWGWRAVLISNMFPSRICEV